VQICDPGEALSRSFWRTLGTRKKVRTSFWSSFVLQWKYVNVGTRSTLRLTHSNTYTSCIISYQLFDFDTKTTSQKLNLLLEQEISL